MRVVLQRVTEASVRVGNEVVGSIGRGVLLLSAVERGDTEERVCRMAEKCVHLRVFPNDRGHFEHSVLDEKGEVLAVSQFTLCGDTRKGRRPSLTAAAPPEVAEALFDRFVKAVESRGVPVATGRFGALMQVYLVNDGPVTFLLDT